MDLRVEILRILLLNSPNCISSRPEVPRGQYVRNFFGENDKWHDKPLQEALFEALRANEIAGVTVCT